MTTFKEIELKRMFYHKTSLSSSHWLKISETRAICIGSDKKEYQLTQEQPFCPDQIVRNFPNE